MLRRRTRAWLSPLCRTRWAGILVTQGGTRDAEMLRLLDAGGPRSFAIFARLHGQLSTRALENVSVFEGDTHPFAWEHVCSNDFLFEDCMRVVAQAIRLGERASGKGVDQALRSRQLASAMGMYQHLLDSNFVNVLQACPSLPHWLKHEQLRALKAQAGVEYIRAFAEGYFAQKHALEKDPEPNLPIRFWLASHGSDTDRAMLDHVRGEVLFQKALHEDCEKSMRCARCYARKAAATGLISRARERLAYYDFFAETHFPSLDSENAHACEDVYPEHPLDGEKLLEKSEKPFCWENHADEFIFTI
jgi:hypothetical protein